MRPALVSLLVALLTACVACGSPQHDEQDGHHRRHHDKREGDDDGKKANKKKATDYEDTVGDGKHVSGWRWKGKRGDCFYTFDNECFVELKDACRAAGCGKSTCKQDDSRAPIKVRCPKK